MITTVHFTNLLGIFLLAFTLSIGVRLILHQLNILHLRSFGDKVPVNFKDMIDQKTLRNLANTYRKIGEYEKAAATLERIQ